LSKIESLLERVIEENKVRVDLVEYIRFRGVDARLYAVKSPGRRLDTYLVDTWESREIACKPEVVGEEFLELNFRASFKVAKIVLSLLEERKPLVILHILRASKGYMFHRALKHLGIPFREVSVRVKYEEESYRDHVERKPKVVYRDFRDLPGENLILLIADTVATGLSAVAALREIHEELSERGGAIAQLVLYGFLSEKGLEKVREYAESIGVDKIYAFALQDLTPLAYNNYDMPLYGPDESYWTAYGKLKYLGAVVGLETFKEMFLQYAPGMDQPGDWSERQPRLFNGYDYEQGDIRRHLEKSLSMLRSLLEITRRAPWFSSEIEKIYVRRIEELKKAIMKYS